MRVFEVSYNRTIQVKPSESKTIGAKAELDTTENFNQGIFKLISMVDRIKKEEGEGTKPLLNVDDTTIAKALEIANRGI